MIDEICYLLGRLAFVVAVLSIAASAPTAEAEEPPMIAVTIKDHRFIPSEIHVPQGKPFTLKITNDDPTPEEFISTALKVEKVIVGGTYGTVRFASPRRWTLSVRGRVPFRHRARRRHFGIARLTKRDLLFAECIPQMRISRFLNANDYR